VQYDDAAAWQDIRNSGGPVRPTTLPHVSEVADSRLETDILRVPLSDFGVSECSEYVDRESQDVDREEYEYQ
jgi:hypothetical protein